MSRFVQNGRQLTLGVFLWLGACGMLWSAPAPQAEMRPSGLRKPNIILILADDLGYGDLGCYGQTRIKTPNLDRLAAEGMRFTSCYAGSTVCAPSRCALMTGLHTGHAFIRGNGTQSLRASDMTMAELLKKAGYHTGLIGKWGLGNENTSGVPEKKGFDEFAGYLDHIHAHDYYSDHIWRADDRSGRSERITFPENQDGKQGIYLPDLFCRAAQNFVRINQPDQFNRYRPLFLFFSCTIPHANNEEGQRTGNGMQVPADAPYSDEPWPQVEKNKAAMISRLDLQIGQLMAKLEQLKIDQNTLVLFTSDNGPHKEGGVDPKFFQSSGPFRGIKRDLYEGGLRVPLIAWWPQRIKAGVVSDLPCAFWDFLPTVAEIAGVRAPKGLDGISILPTMLGKAQTNQHAFFYWEFHERGFQQAVRMGEWKAIRLEIDKPLELYNLKTDPGEKKDVAVDNPKVIAKLEEYLKTARTESPEWPRVKASKTQATKLEKPQAQDNDSLQPATQ
jgi:arylsulfatase A-like enzyme